MRILLIVVAVLVALPGAVVAVHLTVISLASLFFRQARADGQLVRFLVVIPAHNEERVIGATLESVLSRARPTDTVLVIADRCVDGTARLAKEAGALVLERGEPDSPGRAAAIGDGITWAGEREWDAVVTIDADSVIGVGFFEALESALATGADLVQARSEHIREPGMLARISEAAFAMQGVTLPRGRDRLGLGTRLRGSGMTMRRHVALSRSFSTEGVSEDLFYSLDLTLEGVKARHVDTARLWSLSAPTWSAGAGQRVRWETGRMAAAKEYSLRLLRHRTPASVEAALHLLTPPYAVAVFLLSAGVLIGGVLGEMWMSAGCLGLIAALAGDLAIGLIQSRAPLKTWLALLSAPVYVIWKVWLQVVAMARLKTAGTAYEPTERR